MTVNKLQLQAAIYEYFMLQKKLDNSIKSRVYIEELKYENLLLLLELVIHQDMQTSV